MEPNEGEGVLYVNGCLVKGNLWMMVNDKDKSVVYVAAGSAKDLIDIVLEQEILGTGWTRKELRRRGWKARKVLTIGVML